MAKSILAVKLNLLFLYGAITCVNPYLSCYMRDYTLATTSDIGKIKLFSSIVGMPVSMFICNFADRHRVHRGVYIIMLLAVLVSFSSLLSPMLWDQSDAEWWSSSLAGINSNSISSSNTSVSSITILISANEPFAIEVTDDKLQWSAETTIGGIEPITAALSELEPTTATMASLQSDGLEVTTLEQEMEQEQQPSIANTTCADGEHRNTGFPKKSKGWFRVVIVCVVLGAITSQLSMNLLNSFAANIAVKYDAAYGPIRSWGALGRIATAIMLIFLNQTSSMLFLMPALILFTIKAFVNLMLAVLWPNSEPFDLAEKTALELSQSKAQGPKFKFAQRKGGVLFRSKRVVDDCRLELPFNLGNQKGGGGNQIKESVSVTRASVVNPFDTREDDMFRNIRRCSLAPLGDSYVIKQFELDEMSSKHFRHVIKLEPIKKDNSGGSLSPIIEYCLPEEGRSQTTTSIALPNSFGAKSLNRRKSSLGPGDKKIDIWLHLKILRMMIGRNREFIRFLFLITAIGFVSAMNWLYLFTFIEKINPQKFGYLSAYALAASYISEGLFYLVSPWFIRNFSYSASYSWILIFFGARYLMYLLFTLEGIPLELLIVIESLRPLNMGWLNCVINESALDFALRARECVPELIELGHIDDSEEAIIRVTNGFKATIVSIMLSCCFDGIGVSFGALIGGLVIDYAGYENLWIYTATFSIICGLCNLLFHLRIFSEPNQNSSIAQQNCNETGGVSPPPSQTINDKGT